MGWRIGPSRNAPTTRVGGPKGRFLLPKRDRHGAPAAAIRPTAPHRSRAVPVPKARCEPLRANLGQRNLGNRKHDRAGGQGCCLLGHPGAVSRGSWGISKLGQQPHRAIRACHRRFQYL